VGNFIPAILGILSSALTHTDIFTEALQYDNITDEQHIPLSFT